MELLKQIRALALVLARDALALVSAPFRASRRTWAKLAPCFLLFALALATDRQTAAHLHIDREHPLDQPLTLIENLGRNRIVLSIAGATLAVGGLLRAAPIWRAGALALETQAFANLFNSTFKGIFGRRRPYEEDGAGEFRFFDIAHGGKNGFPSAHSAHSFGLATAVAMSGGFWWGLPAYLLASTVGMARLLHHEHYLADVLAGAGLGIYVGVILGRRRRAARVTDGSGT